MANYQINLYHRQIESPVDKLIYFALHYLRYIIVLTQIVVIAVFFARFQLDQEIIDLKEKIGQKQEIIKVTKPLVEQAKSMSNRINEAQKYLKKQEEFLQIFAFLVNNVPRNIQLQEVMINNRSVNIKGVSVDLRSIVLYYNKLSENKIFSGIELKSINKTDIANFEFSFASR